MRGQIFVLKRTNGMIGIYVNGHRQEDLKSNFSSKDKSDIMFDTIMREYRNQAHNHGVICDIIFCENEEDFKSGMPDLTEYIKHNT